MRAHPVVPALCLTLVSAAAAQDSSPAPILQWFEGTYSTIEARTPDLFMAGYGAVWLPPPGRADSGNWSVGYDVYDRFDLGKPGNPTLYGTQTGLKTVARAFDRAGIDTQIDLVINHNGFSDAGSVDTWGDGDPSNDVSFIEAGGYPGFVLQNPDGGHDPWGVPNTDGDFNSSYDYGDIQGRLSGLIDIDHATNWQFIRHPVDPNDPRNIPAGQGYAFGRTANRPDPNNARFYTDRDGPSISVYDPATGESDIAIYSFNLEDPLAGDAVPENATGLLMRYAQWMVQEIGADGFRIDAAKHTEGFALTYLDRAVYRSNPRKLLDGSTQHVFSYGEVFDSNRDYLLRGPDHGVGDPDWRDNFVRKDINDADPGRVGGNRDVLDFALQDAMRKNLTGNGLANDWRNMVYAGLDPYDDSKMNGSVGVKFVASHDDGGAELTNVAHAFTLLTPGNAVVYFNGKEHGDGRDFPKSTHRGDALGGMYGDTITELVEIRNTHGRGDYRERWLSKEYYAFERSGAMVVLLSNHNGDGASDWSNVATDLAWGTPLVELTGNAAANGLPEVVTVTSDGWGQPNYIRTKFLHNAGQDKGYLVYGLATPQSDEGVQLSNVAQVLEGGDPTVGGGSDDYRNGKTRLTDLHVVKSDTFDVSLATNAVNLLGSIRDRAADGDNALIKIDGGLDLNGNGGVDYVTPGGVAYGFEEFATERRAGYFAEDGNGFYRQSIDATALSEGTHFVTVRAFRHRDDGGPAVYSDFRKVVYVDRLKPISELVSNEPITQGVNENRSFLVRSVDLTADNVHVLFDLGAALSDEEVLALLSDATNAQRLDRDLWKKDAFSLTKGNHVATIVTFEITGTFNVQRVAGIFTDTYFGRGLGDTNFNGRFDAGDVDVFASVFASRDAVFNAAADLNGDGRVNVADLGLLGDELTLGGADAATLEAYEAFAATVPEPATATLLFAATVAAAVGRPRRH